MPLFNNREETNIPNSPMVNSADPKAARHIKILAIMGAKLFAQGQVLNLFFDLLAKKKAEKPIETESVIPQFESDTVAVNKLASAMHSQFGAHGVYEVCKSFSELKQAQKPSYQPSNLSLGFGAKDLEVCEVCVTWLEENEAKIRLFFKDTYTIAADIVDKSEKNRNAANPIYHLNQLMEGWGSEKTDDETRGVLVANLIAAMKTKFLGEGKGKKRVFGDQSPELQQVSLLEEMTGMSDIDIDAILGDFVEAIKTGLAK